MHKVLKSVLSETHCKLRFSSSAAGGRDVHSSCVAADGRSLPIVSRRVMFLAKPLRPGRFVACLGVPLAGLSGGKFSRWLFMPVVLPVSGFGVGLLGEISLYQRFNKFER